MIVGPPASVHRDMGAISPTGPSPIDLMSLAKASTAALRARWRQVFGPSSPCPTSREFLLYTLAWQLQADQQGGLSSQVSRHLATVMNQARTKDRSRPVPSSARLPVGTVLLKTWQGQEYRVEVVKGGFAFQGQTYVSLSEIARVITGTRWNGPAFFGLRRPSSTQKKKASA